MNPHCIATRKKPAMENAHRLEQPEVTGNLVVSTRGGRRLALSALVIFVLTQMTVIRASAEPSQDGIASRQTPLPIGTVVKDGVPRPPVMAEQLAVAIHGEGVRSAIIMPDRWNLPPQEGGPIPRGFNASRSLRQLLWVVTGKDATPFLSASEYAKREKDDSLDFRIWIGDQPRVREVLGEELAGIDEDGFVIRCTGRDLYICGKGPWGTEYAVFDLMERWAGCRMYGPPASPAVGANNRAGGLFHIIPRAPVVRVPRDAHVVDNPSFRMRWMRQIPSGAFRMRLRDRYHHNLLAPFLPSEEITVERDGKRVVDADRLKAWCQAHSEWFPEIKGQRFFPPANAIFDFQPCIGNPEVLDVLMKNAAKHFADNPEEGCYSVGMNDSDRFCECARCQALVPPAVQAKLTGKGERTAYAYMVFYNRVATRFESAFPGKRLGCLAYASLSSLPSGLIKLHPLIIPYLTRDSAQLFEANQVEEFKEITERWASMASRVGIYEYLMGEGFVIPRIYNRYLLKNLQTRYGMNADGFYAEDYPNFGVDGVKYWLAARMLWNNNQDPAALMRQYCEDLFGPAAGSMGEYFAFLEEAWCTQESVGMTSPRSNYRWLGDKRQMAIFPPAKSAAAWGIIDKGDREIQAALEALPADAGDARTHLQDCAQRLRIYKACFELSRVLCDRYDQSQAVTAVVKKNDASFTDTARVVESGLKLPAIRPAWEAVEAFAANPRAPAPLFMDAVEYHRLSGAWGSSEPLACAFYTCVEKAVLEGVKTGGVARPGPVLAGIDRFLDKCAGELKGEAPTAIAQVREVAKTRGVFFVRTAKAAPILDGKIGAEEWGKPVFRGRFFLYGLFDESPLETVVYAQTDEKYLYLALDCEAHPEVMGADIRKNDSDPLRPNRQGHKDDCVALSLLRPRENTPLQCPPKGQIKSYFTAIVNMEGAIHDEATDLNAGFDFCEAKVSKNEKGWQVEMAIDLAKIQVDWKSTMDRGLFLCLSRYYREKGLNNYRQPMVQSRCATLLPTATLPMPVGVVGYANSYPAMTYIWGARLLREEGK